MITHSNCPLCQSRNISPWFRSTDFMLSKEDFELWKCRDCGFAFTQNIPSVEEIGRYYQGQEYISHSDTRKGLMNRLYHAGRTFMLRKKHRMVEKVTQGKKLLDIGTGTGYFPGYMKTKGFDAIGVEVDPKARAFAEKEFGLKVFPPEDFIARKLVGKFEVITLWHVMEHLHDFNLYLERMKEYLAPGGTLVIALPNCESLDARFYKKYWAGYDVPRHLWHFTPSTLKILAGKHSFEIMKMKRLPLDPFYNSMLSEKYRKNRLYMISGWIIGEMAYLESLFSLRKSSSVVYFLTTKMST